MLKHITITIIIFLNTFSSFCQIKLPAIFNDDMVIQQQQQVAIWGTDKPNTKIAVSGSWGKAAMVEADNNGYWKLKLQTPSAGGPFTITFKGSDVVTLNNVLVGEVWLVSGQSNMEMSVSGNFNEPVVGSMEAVLNSSNEKIRMFTQKKVKSLTPLYEMTGGWKTSGPASTGSFSAVGYFFAKKLQAILGVPVGIIHTSWGAATIESWMDKQSLADFKNVAIPDTLPAKEPQKVPTMMYNSMLHQYIGYSIKGVLWYQGESNRENADQYQAMLTTMIGSWRKQWQQGDFPFYFAQIAPFGYPKLNAAYVREAQLRTMQTVKNTGMAVTLDIGEEKSIHPSQKEMVGNRLAYWALVKDYNIQGIAFSGPVYKEMKITNNGRINVSFEFSGQGLSSFGKSLTDFEIAGEDKVFYPANAVINNGNKVGSVTVWSDSVKNPVSVRYAFKNWVVGSLYNSQGLPASSFRTDNW